MPFLIVKVIEISGLSADFPSVFIRFGIENQARYSDSNIKDQIKKTESIEQNGLLSQKDQLEFIIQDGIRVMTVYLYHTRRPNMQDWIGQQELGILDIFRSEMKTKVATLHFVDRDKKELPSI